MGKIVITPQTTVKEMKDQFKNEFGGSLRVYSRRSEASDKETLVSLGAKTGSIEFRASRTVGSFCEEVQKELNLKVKVATIDNWVMVLDGITLATIKDIPKQCTKAQMEEFIGYQRKKPDENKEMEEVTIHDFSKENIGLTTRKWDQDGLPVVSLKFQRYFFKKCSEERARDYIDEEGVYPGIFIACGSEDFINYPFDAITFIDESDSFYFGFERFLDEDEEECFSLLYYGNMLYAKFDQEDYPREYRERTLSALETILDIPEDKRITNSYDGPEAIFEIEIQDDPEISDEEIIFKKRFRIFEGTDGSWISEELPL